MQSQFTIKMVTYLLYFVSFRFECSGKILKKLCGQTIELLSNNLYNLYLQYIQLVSPDIVWHFPSEILNHLVKRLKL